MVQIEETTECSLSNEMDETDGGECTIDEGTMNERNSSLPGIDHMIGEGTRKGRGSSFREGEGIAYSDSYRRPRPAYSSGKLGDEDMGHFSSRLDDETKIKRTGYSSLRTK